MYQEAFFEKHQSLPAVLSGKAENTDRACTSDDTEEILKAHNAMLQALVTYDVERKMDIFEHDRNSSPLFVAMCNYMSMAMTMNLFIRAVQHGHDHESIHKSSAHTELGTLPVSPWGILQAFLCTGYAQLCTNDSRVPGRSGISEK